jgi:hypothetical protein
MLMISMGQRCAKAMAKLDLPAAVGPSKAKQVQRGTDSIGLLSELLTGEVAKGLLLCSLASSQEQRIQSLHAQLMPCGATVIALIRPLRDLHLPEQIIHLRNGQLPIGPHCGMTRHACKQLVAGLLDNVIPFMLSQITQHATYHGDQIGIP